MVPLILKQTAIWKGNASSNHPSPKSYEFIVSGVSNGVIIHPTSILTTENPWKPIWETMAPPRSSQAFLRLRGPPRIRYHCASAWGSTVGEHPKNLYLLGIYIGDSRYTVVKVDGSTPKRWIGKGPWLTNTWEWQLHVLQSRSSPSMLDSAGDLYGHPLNLDLIFTHLNEQWSLATKPFHIRYLCLHSNLALLVDIP